MHIPQWLLFASLETLVLLVVILVVLALDLRHVRALLKRQQAQLRQAVKHNKEPPPPENEPQPPVLTPQHYLEQQRQFARERFDELAPEADPNDTTDLPLDARVAALRYALLGEELDTLQETPWETTQWEHLQQVLESLMPAGDSDPELEQELATAHKRIDNLEKFKKLFFDMESQWNSARAQAQGYHDELAAMANDVADQEKFDDILERYYNVYNEIDASIQSANERDAAPERTVTRTRNDPRTSEELDKLRNVAADQHRIIGKLQKRLEDAQSAEEKEQVIGDLQHQLEQQLRYVKESETCVQLLENELNTTVAKLNEYEQKMGDQAEQNQEMDAMRTTLEQFTLESKDLIKRLETLEEENRTLRESAPVGDGNPAALEALQQQHSDLKAQYAELEEKYLALKMEGL